MTLQMLLEETARHLQPRTITCPGDRRLGRFEAELLLAHVLKKDRAWLVAHGEEMVTPRLLKRLHLLVKRRQRHEPIAYILGEKEFYGRSFKVMSDVLIPRPETEELVSIVVLDIDSELGAQLAATIPAARLDLWKPLYIPNPFVIWDVGTGCGAIAVTLASEIPHASVVASDIDPAALRVARRNAKRLGVQKRITFLQADLFDRRVQSALRTKKPAYSWPTCLVVTANLPYLPLSDKKILAPDVARYEPHHALFSGKDGLSLVSRLLHQLASAAPDLDYEETRILIEFDPPQVKQLVRLSRQLFPNTEIEVHQDFAKRPRILQINVVHAH